MKLFGQVRKMKVEPEAPIQYFLNLNEESHSLNSYIGNKVKIKWQGIITCVECGRKTKKSYDQGYCFVCSRDLPENEMCSFVQNFVNMKMEMRRRKSFGGRIAILIILFICP